MKIAVLMSTYNGEKYIRQQLDSILAQDMVAEIDIFVRDDGSEDGTQKILQEYSSAGKLYWYTGDNLKPAKSFIDLILHCPGYDYYAFADQDDYWLPNKISRSIEKLQGQNAPALYFSNALLVDARLNSLERKVYKCPPRLDLPTLSCAGGLLGCTMVFNQALGALVQSGSVPDSIVMHDFYVALVCALAGGNIIYDSESSMLYRQHGKNVIGASYSKLSAIRERLHSIMQPSEVAVGQQAQTVLRQYPTLGSEENRNWLAKLSNRSLASRLSIACSRKTRYSNKNRSITLRLAILLGNR